MRRHASWIVLVIAAVFILSMAIGGISSIFAKGEYLGIIDGDKITPTKFREYFENALATYAQQNKDEQIDDAKYKELNDQTWNQLVRQRLYEKEIKKRKLKVTKDDIVAKMREPFDDIKEIEQLKTDGKFDYDKYEILLIENPEFANWIEARIIANLPYEKLFDDVKSEVTLTPEEVHQDYYEKNNKAEAKIIFFDPNQAKIEVTDEDMKKYYEENKEDYKKGAGRKLKYAKLALEASEEDKELAKVKADSIHQEIIGGLDFTQAAIDLSEGPSAPKGGDLGFFTRGRMVKEFSDVAFTLSLNEVSNPVLSQFGWHIIKVFEKRKNDDGEVEVKASHILIKTEPSEKTKANLEIIANDLFAQAKNLGIDSASAVMSCEVKETKEFYEDDKYIGGIGSNEELIKFAFSKKVGKIHEPIKIRDDYIIAEISFKIGKHYQTLESQKNKIKRETKSELALQEILKRAKEFTEKFEHSEYLAEAKKADWKIIEAKDIILDKTIPGLRKDENLNKAILELEENKNTDLIINDFGAYIAFVSKRTVPDMEKFEEDKENLIAEAQEKAENEHLNEWYRELNENAEIEDNRDKYYSF